MDFVPDPERRHPRASELLSIESGCTPRQAATVPSQEENPPVRASAESRDRLTACAAASAGSPPGSAAGLFRFVAQRPGARALTLKDPCAAKACAQPTVRALRATFEERYAAPAPPIRQSNCGFSPVDTRPANRQQADILTAGVRSEDLYVDHGISGAQASRPNFDRVLDALEAGDTLVIKTLHQFGRPTHTHAFAEEFRGLGVGLRVLNPGGDGGSIASSPGRMLPGCASHIFCRAMRIPGRDSLQRRSFGAVRKLPGRHDSQPRPQIIRVGLLRGSTPCVLSTAYRL